VASTPTLRIGEPPAPLLRHHLHFRPAMLHRSGTYLCFAAPGSIPGSSGRRRLFQARDVVQVRRPLHVIRRYDEVTIRIGLSLRRGCISTAQHSPIIRRPPRQFVAIPHRAGWSLRRLHRPSFQWRCHSAPPAVQQFAATGPKCGPRRLRPGSTPDEDRKAVRGNDGLGHANGPSQRNFRPSLASFCVSATGYVTPRRIAAALCLVAPPSLRHLTFLYPYLVNSLLHELLFCRNFSPGRPPLNLTACARPLGRAIPSNSGLPRAARALRIHQSRGVNPYNWLFPSAFCRRRAPLLARAEESSCRQASVRVHTRSSRPLRAPPVIGSTRSAARARPPPYPQTPGYQPRRLLFGSRSVGHF